MLRRDAYLFLKDLLSTLIIVIVLLAVSAGSMLAVYRGSQSIYSPVSVALVDEEDSLLSRIAINLISNQSYMKSLLTIEKTNSQKALRGLYNGDYAAIVQLPEGYLDNIMHGRKGGGSIILSDAAASNADLVRAVAEVGQLLLAAGQYGVFTGEKLIAEHALGSEFYNSYLEKSNKKLLSEAKNAYNDYFEVVTLPYSGTSLPAGAYFACLWLAFVLFLGGLFFNKLCTRDCTPSMYGRLLASGIRGPVFIFGKVLYPLLFRVLLCGGVLALLSRFIPLNLDAGAIILALFALAVISVFTSCLMLAMSGTGGANGVIIILSTAGLFLTGGIIPPSMLPNILAGIGRLLPHGVAASLLAGLFGGDVPAASILLGLAYSILAMLICLRFLKYLPAKGGDVS